MSSCKSCHVTRCQDVKCRILNVLRVHVMRAFTSCSARPTRELPEASHASCARTHLDIVGVHLVTHARMLRQINIVHAPPLKARLDAHVGLLVASRVCSEVTYWDRAKCECQEGVAIETQRERPRARKGLVSGSRRIMERTCTMRATRALRESIRSCILATCSFKHSCSLSSPPSLPR